MAGPVNQSAIDANNAALQRNRTDNSLIRKAANTSAQLYRIPGGIAQGTVKTLLAGPLAVEGLKDALAPSGIRLSPRHLGDSNELPTKTNVYANGLGDVPKDAISTTFNPNMRNEWQPISAPSAGSDSGSMAQRGISFARTVDRSIQDWTDSWVPAPQTKAAEFTAKAADAFGEAVPAAALAVSTGGLSPSTVLAGTTLSRGAGAANAFTSELVEGSGNYGNALIAGGTEWAAESIGAKYLNGGSLAIDAAGEGLEEVLSGGMQAVLTGEAYTPAQAMEEFALGATVGAAMGGFVDGISNIVPHNNSSNQSQVEHVYSTDATMQNPISGDPTSVVIETIADTQALTSTSLDGPKVDDVGAWQEDVYLNQLGNDPDAWWANLDGAEEFSTVFDLDQTVDSGLIEDTGSGPGPNGPVDLSPSSTAIQTLTIENLFEPIVAESERAPITDDVGVWQENAYRESRSLQQETGVEQEAMVSQVDTKFTSETTADASIADSTTSFVNAGEYEVQDPANVAETVLAPVYRSDPASPVISATKQDGGLGISMKTEQQEEIEETSNPIAIPTTTPLFAPNAISSVQPQATPDMQTQPNTVSDTTITEDNHPQASAQTAPKNEMDAHTLAQQIWTPVQTMTEQTIQRRQEKLKDKQPAYDFGLLRGSGAQGKIFESAGYNRTFGGMSSY